MLSVFFLISLALLFSPPPTLPPSANQLVLISPLCPSLATTASQTEVKLLDFCCLFAFFLCTHLLLSFSLTIPLSSFLPLEFNLFQRNCFIAFRPNPKPLGITCVFVCVFLFATKPHVSFSIVLGYFNVTSSLLFLPFSFSSLNC